MAAESGDRPDRPWGRLERWRWMMAHSSSYTMNHPARPAMARTNGFSLAIRRYCDYEQVVDFRMPGVAVLGLDEGPPLGHGWGPSPVQMLGASLGACLGAALMRFLRDANVDVVDLRTEVNGTIRDDTRGRPHLASVAVRLTPVLARAEDMRALPSPDRIAERSMVADSLRPDVGLQLVITPEVRTRVQAPAHDDVRMVRTYYGNAREPHAGAARELTTCQVYADTGSSS